MADIILGQHPLLKKEFIDKRVRALIGHQFVADQLFTASAVDALAIKYLQDADKDSKDRQAYDGVPEVGEGSTFQRIGLNEEEKIAMIKNMVWRRSLLMKCKNGEMTVLLNVRIVS